MKVLFVNADDTSRHVSSANTAIYPNLGLLTLMSAVAQRIPRQEIGYLDGTVYGNSVVRTFITDNAKSLEVLCFSALTANYGASVQFSRIAKELNPKIITRAFLPILLIGSHGVSRLVNPRIWQSAVFFGIIRTCENMILLL